MDETRLKSLYRRSAQSLDASVSAEDLGEVLSRSGYPDQEGTLLDRVVASNAHADLLRTAMALRGDAESLSRELRGMQAPTRRPSSRAWIALAAGVGAAAILVLALRPGTGPGPTMAEQAAADETIMAASFEAASRDSIMTASFEPVSEIDAPAPSGEDIFDGGFDS